MGKFGYLDSIILKDKEVMKEVKEVVHVPTIELAEEVLRVIKDNKLPRQYDLDTMIKSVNQEYLCIRFSDVCMFSSLSFYKDHCYTVITAQEFLSRYNKKFKPIAMKCTKKQFKTIKPKLVGCKVVCLSRFTDCVYLVNNLAGRKYEISNVLEKDNSVYNRQVFEEWNEKTFLEYCGISIGTEDSYKDVHVKGCFNTDKYELEQLRKENAYLEECIGLEKRDKESLEREIYQLKEQLKSIEDQPKVGDVCLFWDKHTDMFVISKLSKSGGIKGVGKYENCIKATLENIQAKINELKND